MKSDFNAEVTMAGFNLNCVCNSDLDRIAFYARRRFLEGIDTITLMEQASNEQEKREIAYAALLDLDDDSIRRLNLLACDNSGCKADSYRRELQQMLAGSQGRVVGF
ncbi:hypothetical protein [Motiliproteus sp.]|uniref:hypothetical protein n=1 Tax=Motiliproteus sp. TaxID=1898955 RepID=UPI003BA94994